MGKDQELLQAVKTEDLLTVQKLLQRPRPGKALLGSAKKVNVNFQDTDFSPLHHAALNGNLELISLLLESQAAVDIRDQKMRPLHYAAWQGKAEPMKMLLKSGSSVNGQSDEGQIPLHLSAQHGHYDVSEMLLQHQSNPCIVDNAGKTPLDLACEFGRVVQLLLSSNMCAALLEPKKGDTTDPNGTSPLHLAAKNGHIDIILLIQAGIDINRQTKAGTALHEAALCGKTEAVRLLLELQSGINATVRNTYSQTALDIVYQFTATQASKEIKQLLRASAALQVRALKDYCNNYDLTSLNIKAGDVITVLEQHPDGRWKGCIHDNRTGNDRVGYFPSTMVEVISCRGSEASPQSSPTPSSGPHGGSNEEIWVLRKPVAGDRSSVGSSGSVTSVRSSGSGQSAGSAAHILHAQAEGVKLLATVLSQSAKAKEHLMEQSKSVDQCPLHEAPPYDATATRKGEGPCEGKDLTAIGITKPGHRKKITSEINKLSVTEWLPEHKPASLGEWLSSIGLSQYHQMLVQNGYENIDFITDITWEDLQEIGITKLVMSPKMSTFQDSELSTELQSAMTQPVQEVKAQRTRSLSKDHDEVLTGGGGGGGGPPKKEARTMRQQSSQGSASSHRGSVSSQGKHRHSHSHSQPAPPYTPPHTPTKTRTSSSSSTSSVQSTSSPQAKPKPSPQFIQGERPQSPRSHPPQSPTHRGAPCQLQPQQQQPQMPPQHQAHPHPQHHPQMQAMEVRESQQVPVLSLPPEAELAEEEGPKNSSVQNKRAHTLNRYAVSDSECDERAGGRGGGGGEAEADVVSQSSAAVRGEVGKYATVTHRVSRSHSVRNQEKGANRNQSQSFALRQKKKGPPPPPPKRSSSAISTSNSNLTDANTQPNTLTTTGGMLDVPYYQQRRASDLGVSVETAAVETSSVGSVRSIAAMLEMSSIGGGAKGMALQKNFLQTLKRRPRSSKPHTNGSDFTLQESSTVKRRPKSRDKEPEGYAELATANGEPANTGQPNTTQPVPYQNGTATVKRRPVSDAGVIEQPQPQPQTQPQVTAAPRRDSLDQGAPVANEGGPVRKPKPPVSPKPVVAQIKRQGGPQTPPQPVSNKRVPLPGPGTPGSPEGKKIPPPVSPKPAPPPTAPKPAKLIHSVTGPALSTPASAPPKQHSAVARQTSSPPSFPPSNTPSPPNAKPTSPSSQSPHTPQTPTTPQTPQTPATPSPTPPPVKPPRSSIGGVSVDSGMSGGGVTAPAATTTEFGVDSLVHQKLEETSASLAAALQAVEDKI
uniref:CASK interacting protein 1 n=1 Tax=Pundamilia nyererei TaxID=303518 RepID=A0A3B4GFH2_9CICH